MCKFCFSINGVVVVFVNGGVVIVVFVNAVVVVVQIFIFSVFFCVNCVFLLMVLLLL